MVPIPIPAHLLHTVFQYISPPALPIPPHLLSEPLIERHHFLSISPTDHASYLCWPSPDVAQVTEVLERGLQGASMDAPEHDVRYTAPDEETLLAHVRPDSQSPLQIVFAWDSTTQTWRYHDSRLLPFPEASLPSLDATLAKANVKQHWNSTFRDTLSPISRTESPLPDKYWEGYEVTGSSTVPTSLLTEEDDNAEAAYWASYSMVQGSGDSTMPSPKLKNVSGISQTIPEDRRPHALIDPLVAHLHLRLQQEEEFPSPRASSPEVPRTLHPLNDTETSVNGKDRLIRFPPFENNRDLDGESDCLLDKAPRRESVAKDMASHRSDINGRGNREDDGLKEAIRGIYRMWRTQSGSEDEGTFLEIVRAAIGGA